MKFASKLYVGAAATALCMAAFPAAGQVETPQDDSAATAVEEIVVTGSRIRRSGVQTPTPTTIINAETIRRSGVSEISPAAPRRCTAPTPWRAWPTSS